jgi:hypothetical protein
MQAARDLADLAEDAVELALDAFELGLRIPILCEDTAALPVKGPGGGCRSVYRAIASRA